MMNPYSVLDIPENRTAEKEFYEGYIVQNEVKNVPVPVWEEWTGRYF